MKALCTKCTHYREVCCNNGPLDEGYEGFCFTCCPSKREHEITRMGVTERATKFNVCPSCYFELGRVGVVAIPQADYLPKPPGSLERLAVALGRWFGKRGAHQSPRKH